MPDVTIRIGDKDFTVSCRDGEEVFLKTAAQLLDQEASALIGQLGRVPEPRMLLMSGLMLADRFAAQGERITALESELATAHARIAELEAQPAPEPRTIEVPVVPSHVLESLAEFAARAEALAEQAEEKLPAS
jgi:cell division protein ZapA